MAKTAGKKELEEVQKNYKDVFNPPAAASPAGTFKLPAGGSIMDIPEAPKITAPTTPSNEIQFQPDGTVKYTVNRNPYTLNPAEYKALLGQGEGGQMSEQVQQIIAEKNAARNKPEGMAGYSEQIGNLPPEQQMQQSMGDLALTTGLSIGAIGGGAAVGAKLGAAGGSVFGPVGGLVGGIAGGLIGAGAAFFGKLSIEERQNVKASKANFDNAKSSLNQIVALSKTNPELTPQMIEQWNYNLAIIRSAEQALKKQNSNLIGKKLADNLDELSDIEQFYRDYALLYELPFKRNLGYTR